MSSVYDNWEKLVGAVMRREKDRQLAYCESFSTSYSSDFSSRFSFDIRFPEDEKGGDVKAMEYEEIRRATKNFRPDLIVKEGQLTCVYKGWFDEHNLVTVIKMNGRNYINPKKWMEEKSHLRHPNLLTPIGYCFNTDQIILKKKNFQYLNYIEDQIIFVHEFMSKGSLDSHFYRNRWPEPLPWATRIKVAVGAARGLAFLHSLEKPLINGFLKSADIFLDSDFNAKLLDIGLKEEIEPLCPIYEIEGPWGIVNESNNSPHAAPEMEDYMLSAGNLSTKCDVYSFGVILLELITGRRAIDRSQPIPEIYLIPRAISYFSNQTTLSRIMDRIEGQYHREQAHKIAKLVLQCMRVNPSSRPEMAEVVAALQEL